ncbi:MAG: iron-containing alcohol dehydrogenase family protein [Synechococcales cyanobacterium RU_4_20]|nr:iron-containing alcohol dehydrogenase family protein [Synechococcales cyanobacterium RU_4_20]NJR69405.1 iron-containing alcohol dehydrogenase family protein [Synechococcales cyanobacterium CRU_2_2]
MPKSPTVKSFNLSQSSSDSVSETSRQGSVGLMMNLAPAQVWRGAGVLAQSGDRLAALGTRPLVIGGDWLSQAPPDRTLKSFKRDLDTALADLADHRISYCPDCSEDSLERLRQAVAKHQADFILGVGGGKALDTAKLIAFQSDLPIVTVPTSAATCAAWTALSNVYSDQGAFLYDVPLSRCPDLLILDYDIIQTAPQRTLVAGIGDALAKWYEASVSSGASTQTLVIAAVQQARVLRDILFQKSVAALAEPGGEAWREVVDASVLLAGVIGGLGGAQCRTVAAHAVHNGLTHLPACHDRLHGEKVAYGILVQLRLEEIVQGSQLAATARQQLLTFYGELGLPRSLEDLGLAQATLADLRRAAQLACQPKSDIHHLPFAVVPEQLVAAMVSTTVAMTSQVSPGTAAKSAGNDS